VIDRSDHLLRLGRMLATYPVVALLGARQVGKSTLARQVAAGSRGPVFTFDLERPRDVERLADPETALAPLRGLVVIDEVQRRPDLFPTLRVLADRSPLPARFLILGSASPALLRQSSESLAGRVHHYELRGLSIAEVGRRRVDRLWLRGSFPLSYLARSDEKAATWREDFVRTFLERDLPQLGIDVAATTMRRFWTMLAHVSGQTWNASDIARSLGVSDKTATRYLDHLVATFMMRVLRPWHENLRKRQVKSPKTHFADTGLLHSFQGVTTRDDLLVHPRSGASFEAFGVGQVLDRLRARDDETFHWRTQDGAELDLLVVHGRRRLGFEFKRTVAPGTTRSMHVALADLGLESLDVIHAGDETYPLTDRVRAVAISRLADDLTPLR
jgi:uncharacterized protein